MQLAKQESSKVAEEATSANNQTSKDDVARLLHLFKDPAAQIHWSNHYGVLNRAQLDARRSSGPESDAANSLSCLASIFNDYKNFKPQNQMVAYVYDRATGGPMKKVPYEPCHDDWAELANHTHDLEPTNLARRNILRDAMQHGSRAHGTMCVSTFTKFFWGITGLVSMMTKWVSGAHLRSRRGG